MKQQIEQICFRYDGSEEAIEALKWVNEIEILNGRSKWQDQIDTYFSSDGNWWSYTVPEGYRLVTPAEFLRIVKVESESKWKVGDECMVDDCKITYQILSIINGYAWLYSDEGHITANISALRPVRKSLREEMIEWAKKHESVLEAMPELLSIIDRHEKERGVEG